MIEATAKLKANFIIAHEPSYYNHQDDTGWVENNVVVNEKRALLEKYQITVWRFHDYWHRMKPDGIMHGVLLKTGWLAHNPKEERVFQVPAQPLDDIIRQLKESLKIPHLRYIGDRDSLCSIIALLPGAGGGQIQLSTFIGGKADLLIVGESSEWETSGIFQGCEGIGKTGFNDCFGSRIQRRTGNGMARPMAETKSAGYTNFAHRFGRSICVDLKPKAQSLKPVRKSSKAFLRNLKKSFIL